MNAIATAIKVAKTSRRYNALITETFDLAQQQCAEHLSQKRDIFTLIVKDNFAVENLPMTCASAMLANYTAPYTATVVERLLRKGGCLIGKANLDEFAMGSTNLNSHFKPVRNPCTPFGDLDNDFYVAGGSSGGCAVAVRERIANVAIGSDTGGSTRIPASFNGVVGFKPSYGLVSRAGLVPLVNSFDCPSFFTRKVEDCVRYFGMTLGVDPYDCTSIDAPPKPKHQVITIRDLRRVRIGIPQEFLDAKVVSADCQQMWTEAAKLLSSQGVTVKTVSLPHAKHSTACYHVLNSSDVFSNMARYDSVRYGFAAKKPSSFAQQLNQTRTNAFNSVVRKRILAGNFFNLQENKGKYFLQAAKIRRLIHSDFNSVFAECDALFVPSTSHSAPRVSEVQKRRTSDDRNDDFFTQSANLCGLPAISIPYGKSSTKLPMGMQFICPHLSDWQCLALGQILQDLANLSK